MQADKSIHILVIEDDEGDALLINEALEECSTTTATTTVYDGTQAIDYLEKQNGFEQAKKPDLILLDLNMPRVTGHEFISIVKQDERFNTIPILVLTTSDAKEDICQSYANHANCFITKPVDVNEFIDMVKAIENFWLRIAQLPQSID